MRLLKNQSEAFSGNTGTGPWHLKPLAQAIALLLVAGGAQAQPLAFSSNWFAAKGAAQASGAARPGVTPGSPPPLAQQQRANQVLQRSLSNLNNTVAAIAAQQAAQAAGRSAALIAPQTIHNGLGGNGLNFVIGPDGKPLFVNAEAPVQTDSNGKTNVSIKQTADKAILNWETFNIGRDTTLEFQQNADWAVLNKVNNATAPSQIQGQIKGAGTVMVLNQNGVIFSGSSQVNVRNLVVAATTMKDEDFRDHGLYNGTQPVFTGAAGKVEVQSGARIETHAPASSTAGGGYVLLLGSEVENAGTISTQKGQTLMAAGDSFVIRKGYSTDGNPNSTTRGNEVSVIRDNASAAGKVTNSGIVMAATGDITLAGHEVMQNGVLLASTSVDTRGTLHLNATGNGASVVLGEGSTSAILIDNSSALNSQLSGQTGPITNATDNIVGAGNDRRALSRVEVNSDGTVDFRNGSITLATGGQVMVNAGQRSLVRDGATIDVSGAVGVQVAMEANSIKVNIQGNEQRDAAVNRDGGKLNSTDVWVDVRDLVFVPAGTNGYPTDRWYTAGGLLEVSGYLGTQAHSIGEWMAQGGVVNFTGNDVVTQAGSQINVSGGTLDVQGGMIKQSWLKGANGRLYEISSAPGDILYTGIYKGYESTSTRWGQTEYFYNPLLAPRERYESGYVVGRDAGSLVIGTRNAVLEGNVVGDTFQGDRQTRAPQAGLDGYNQSQKAAARGAQLVVGNYVPYYVKSSGLLQYALGADANTLKNVVLNQSSEQIAAGLDLNTALPTDRQGTLMLNTDRLNGFNLGALKVAATGNITVDSAVQVGNGGNITLFGPQVDVNANLTARAGTIQVGNVLQQFGSNGLADSTLGGAGRVTVGQGVKLDARGLWTNQMLETGNNSGLAYLNGGTISLRSSGDLTLGTDSVVDVSSGGALLFKNRQQGGKGGDVTLAANANVSTGTGKLTLGGEIRGQGVNGGGTLSMQAGKVLISDSATGAPADTLLLNGGFFNKGFSAYDIKGNQGLIVADGTQVDVSMPVYRFGEQALVTPGGGDPSAALETWTPPVYQEDAIKGVLTQRKGASLSLQAGTFQSTAADMATVEAVIGKGAVINVDPGQSIAVRSIGQLTVDGRLNAWGGNITLGQVAQSGTTTEVPNAAGHGRSIWIGEQAVLDVAARAVTAVDVRGNRYGQVRRGGSIVIGGEIDHATGQASAADLFVVIREGATLDASGAQATLDIPGQGAIQVASDGGSISIASRNGVYLDGDMFARAGGVGAAGGSLAVALESNSYLLPAADRVLQLRELIISQHRDASLLPLGSDAGSVADSLAYGHGRLAADQVRDGGFGNLALLSNGVLSFDGDVNLALNQSLSLYSGALGLAESSAANARIQLSAAYVRLAGLAPMGKDFHTSPTLRTGTSTQATQGVFEVQSQLLDVRDQVRFGARGTIAQQAGSLTLDRRGFEQVNLRSEGDMRLLASTGTIPTTSLITPAALGLIAAQIYPDTNAQALISARRVDIGRTTATTPRVPYSAFGRLTVEADLINQGGVLRAPLGSLILGRSDAGPGNPAATAEVNLLSGSLTSVSGKGLIMPYGGTVDGITYLYNGVPLDKSLLSNEDGKVPRGIEMRGQSVAVDEGAVVDVSGGGDLTGAGFISGRGGSTDARFNPLVQFNADGSFTLPGLSTNPIYAIIPGVQAGYAPGGSSDPVVGRQITIGAGVPGLPAGIYTLLPSSYALLPGAFRVEINGLSGQGGALGAQAMRNGSWSTSGSLSIAGTGIRDSLSSQVIVTSADVLRRYSQYNETSLSSFILADAAKLGVPPILMARDAKAFDLKLDLNTTGRPSFSFSGQLLAERGAGGNGSTTAITTTQGGIEVVAKGTSATPGFVGVTLEDADLNAIGSKSLALGGAATAVYGQGGNYLTFKNGSNVTLRSGAGLVGPEVFLLGNVLVEQGASISTLGQGAAARQGAGYIYAPGTVSVLAVSNDRLNVLAPEAGGSGSIRVGGCDTTCTGTTSLYSEGTIVMATNNTFALDESVRYGTRHLTLAVGAINAGSAQSLADMAANNALPSGLTLNQSVLDRLLRGDTSTGAPALETLELSARDAFNFYGDVILDTYDSVTGQSRLKELVLTTPAIYGAGTSANNATIRTADLIWNGAQGKPGTVVNGGAGTGSGNLNIQAERIEFGYGPNTQPGTLPSYDRLALGFANVNLSASDRITANHKGSLAVYQSQGAYVEGKGYSYSGGNLNMLTPLLTGEAGSVNKVTAGGAIRMSAPAGSTPGDATLGSGTLGAELALSGKSIVLDTRIALPSGKLTLDAEGDLTLTDAARIDMSGRKVSLNDVDKYSWGGDATLQSRTGSIRQAAGSVIDLRAVNNQAGTLKVVALDPAAGLVDLQGQILGSSSGYYDAGGTLVPYKSGGVDIRAQRLGLTGTLDSQFAALNQRLNDGQVFGSRSFQLKQGDLNIGSDIKAGDVNVSVDNGRLTVSGTIDASGERVGSIRLAGKNGLTLDGNAVLDAHGSVLRVDSYGKIIDSPNRAIVELSSGDGTLTLASGARIDLRHGTAAKPGQGDGQARGTLELNAPRIGSDGRPTSADGSQGQDAATHGDIAIDARTGLIIQGAKSIALNAVQRYTDAKDGVDPAVSGRPYQYIDQDYLDQKDKESAKFIENAVHNNTLLDDKLAGLHNATYDDVFHLRPGVEVVAKGDLVVQGDLDLSGYRYASLRAGEAGALVMRAGGDLDIYGSINDGFAPPPKTQDDTGWLLTEGKQMFGGDVVLPKGGIVLQQDTAFPAGKVLNYDLPIQALTVAAGTVLPATGTLRADISLPAGTVLSGAIYNANGTLAYAAGTLLDQPLVVVAGMKLGAGTRLAGNTALDAMTWPAGVPLPSRPQASINDNNPNVVLLAGSITLLKGSVIPSMTDLKLGGKSIDLRDGAQGSNWAVAQMLPEGSQSWSIRLVAGADTAAADTRLTDPYAEHGTIRLADTHYGMTAVPAAGALVWTKEGSLDIYGDESMVGKPIDFDLIGWPTMCQDSPSFCAVPPPVYLWTREGSLDIYGDESMVGQPIDFALIGWPTMCEDSPGFCKAQASDYTLEPSKANFSVLRTGTGDLELLSAGNLNMNSLYGVYTAGSSTPVSAEFNRPRGRNGTLLPDQLGGYESLVDGGTGSLYRAWYPDHGGNLLLSVGGNLTGDALAMREKQSGDPAQLPSASLGNWLWRQGSGTPLAGGDNIPTAWWINFGTYTSLNSGSALTGFTGFGTLGGGNVDVRVGGDAGTLVQMGDSVSGNQSAALRSQGLILAVGSTGRVGANGQLMLTGGGDLNLQVGGGVNPTLAARNPLDKNGNPLAPIHDLQGALINLRGNLQVQAGALGGIDLHYGAVSVDHDKTDTRSFDPYTASLASSTGGLVLIPGDATISLSTRGDLVVGGATDPGRVSLPNSVALDLNPAAATPNPFSGMGYSWFSLWTDHTAIDLFSAGGNLTPSTQLGEIKTSGTAALEGRNSSATDGRFVYPSILRAVAANGSFYYGPSALYSASNLANANNYSLLLAPSANGQLEFLAADSLYGGGYAINQSGAAASAIATPFKPAFIAYDAGGNKVIDNQGGTAIVADPLAVGGRYPLFAFGADTASTRSNVLPARFYARDGDIVGLRTGEILSFANGSTWYESAGPVRIMAGRDIVSSGKAAGGSSIPTDQGLAAGETSGNLFAHNDPTDISVIQAGRDLLYSAFNVAGPGTLEVTAGRNILMEDKVSITSLGAVVPGDSRPGADIVLQAGAGSNGADYARFIAAYLDPANLAQPGESLSGQGAKVAKTYEAQLVAWLAGRYGFSGDVGQARAYYAALAPEQQRVFAREVYFAELKAGGREYNQVGGPREGSYLRGREAIAALFPETDVAGNPIGYQGDITLFGGSGVHTNFGGSIQMLTPGGKQVFGIEGAAPPSTAGVITQGSGDIQLYSQGSILLGQSRIMTTFGGSIMGWSAQGDINAGRGSKTTVVYTPPKRVYDDWGNVSLSPAVPSTGAGIATLNPIPEVKPGDIDLIAPLGTIDAGEAGIRVSGNVNIAALHVVNAANIQVQGKSSGVPVVASVNTGAITSASAAASSATQAADDVARQQQANARQNQPSVFTVQVLSFGQERLEPSREGASRSPAYNPDSPVQVLGAGPLDEQARQRLTAEERGNLTL
ncbi:filamentous haemagglutinin family protein [Pseudomonas gingeri]|uniref:Filamentous hemagglutinin family protein n=4 Tax=Pseudomonas gingeri TaxID=117681 RepID=A0A7Y8CC91_9PSED|nr:filamentous haemagglutinin family protein [Pseudomonas gingeri]NWC13438.1 filamentous hemagglutinin family protein [Pseudomonas gingeri]